MSTRPWSCQDHRAGALLRDLTTNGWFVTEEVAQKLSKAGMDRLSVSITGLDAEQHDTFMKKEGAHAKAMDAMKLLRKPACWPYRP